MQTEENQNNAIELVQIAKNSEVEFSKAESITFKYVPFLLKIRSAEEEAKKINFENPSELDEKIAREIRLSLVPNRTEADKLKKKEKAEFILLNGLHDDAFGIVEKTSKLLELKLLNVEKQREIVAKAKIEALRNSRLELILPFGSDFANLDLGSLTEEVFESIYSGAKASHEAKIRAELEAENARIEAEKKAREEAEKNRIEAERLKKENERIAKEAELARIEAEKEAAKAKAEADRLAAEAKKKADAELEEARKKAKEEADRQAEEIRKQKEESDRLAAELKKKEDEEKEAARLKVEEEAKRIAEEKKAAKAPDKEKLKVWIENLSLPLIELKQNESNVLASDLKVKLSNYKIWALKEIEKL